MPELKQLRDLHNISRNLLPTPRAVEEEFPLTAAAAANVLSARTAIQNILDGRDRRCLMVVGPCSIHDRLAAEEFAARLAGLATELSDAIFLVMRTYFEKPRTTVGWKGFINDPDLDDTFHIEKGLRLARQLLLQINSMGVPVGTEALDPITPQYLDDLVAWTAIGARTVESQTHREMASGLSTPVGFKNGTDGSLTVAINALRATREHHHFLGINREGQGCVFHTTGNPYGHIVLRGGAVPNYFPEHIQACEVALSKAGLRQFIMVDCSHGNSQKLPERQKLVLSDCLAQIENGNRSIRGFMLESNLNGGSQELQGAPAALHYGVSITDACIDWETTAALLREAAARLRPVIARRQEI